jgi:outer membrane protein insertion porin family
MRATVGLFYRCRGVVLALLCVLGMAAATGAQAQTIEVRGNQRIEADSIRQYFIPGPGERLDGAKIDQAIKELFDTGLFADVRVSRSGGAIIVSVVENAVINQLRFDGNSALRTETLEAEVQSRSRGPFSQAIIDSDVQRIREVYRRAGRSDAQVSARTANAPNGRIDVTFVIDEGDKTGVAAIVFEGNEAFSDWRLKRVMTTTESNLFSWLKTSDIYDPERLQSDLDLIRRFYLENGYADFRVVASDARYDADRKGYIIEIVVDEGEQYKVGAVEVESRISDIDPAELRSRVETTEGRVYSAREVERTVDGINAEVQRRGYAFAQVRPRGDRNAGERTVTLVYTVEQGPRVFIERINIRGNTKTRDYVIRREFDVGEGDAFNRFLIDRAERRLRALGFFRSVRITTEPGSSPDRVVVNVDVEDQPTGSFSFSGGYSTADGFLGEVSLSERNFLGRGQEVRASVSYGQRVEGFELSFTEPYFLGQRISAGVDIYSKYNDFTQTAYYENRLTGGSLRLGFPLTEELTVGLRYSLFEQRVEIPNTRDDPWNDCVRPIAGFTGPGDACVRNGEASLPIQEIAAGEGVWTSMIGFNAVYNSLDNPQDPTSGFLLRGELEVAGAGGDSQYVRATADARYFYPLFDELVGMVRLQGGQVLGYGDEKLRVTDHFNVGPNLVRGFAPNGIGPRDRSNTTRGALGATTYLGGSLELQFPVPVAPREFGLRGAVFVDAGTAFGYDGKTVFNERVQGPNTLDVLDDAAIRSSVGVGLLWASPIGPIRFDYAYALSKAKGDRTQAFRFQGGTNF